MNVFGVLAGIFGAMGVAAGAFGAHALASRVEPRMLEIFETAARYQMYHALALLAVAWVWQSTSHSTTAQVAGWAFTVGIVLFCGSLYAMVFSGVRVLGAITPLGGVGFIVGWIALAVAMYKTGA